jgi:LysM repeat protein
MTDTRNDKGSVSNLISAYRGRQNRADNLLPFFWIGIMLLVVGAGYLIYRFLLPSTPLQALNGTQTATPTETVIPSSPTVTVLAATATELQDQTGTPVPSEIVAAASVITYTVQQGDTLASIAERYGVGLPTLQALNPLVTPELLNVGDQLSIPAQGKGLATVTPMSAAPQTIVEYQVAAGDTLVAIAERYGSTIEAIVRENNLESPDEIQEGQTLKIPVEAGTSPAATPGKPSSTPEMTTTPTPES